jgi:LPXTG-motif cell wall-anchored protein
MRKFFVGAAVAAVAVLGAVSPASAAGRDCEGSGSLGKPECSGVEVEAGTLTPAPVVVVPVAANPTSGGNPTSVSAPSAAAPAAQPRQNNSLPVTGSETGVLAAAGVMLIGGGVVMVARSRRSIDA